ncbi:RrF2 family transcriptional regulator [Gluconobacter wancherniae]|uniref:Rrf2 family transcriptional regulator n=1 Tax=Gluconobacter wancherniae NBRC 103581 TaxID=656744 RepID=A0A511B2Q8_9PROT|nr:Rrf2 family transcriptional regulator [Gluconobacter wancherniae]MBF0854832.1 transcriptional regulator [Gluconobacter wancherniae]MBS1064296.1 Rrf2 family transcriptional regulator [Gluconobacter wancherniae]MBS1089522.1 Rrf2 family transcriptional regulator [Gluconobacter wancherniae]MBS1095622.1 Rrf2 family transcriptional regulator [Gluconobacter wancherniae]GBD58003.1 Rrf2 family transcriptional regulator [Gluconobacter wancherniae NBRC 103581]
MYLRRDRALTAVSIMLDVAFYAGRAGVVSGADIARRGDMLRRGIEPVLQALSRAQLLDSIRGPKGGYRLARAQRTISLKEIVEAATLAEREADEESQGSRLFQKVVGPFWQSLDKEVSERMSGVTLDDLIREAEDAGLRRPNRAPISFSI